ncbi:MAG: MarR family transcriptional regulator [Pseudomonadota bacterium]
MSGSAAQAICQFIPPFMRFLRDGLAEVHMSPARFQILQTLRYEDALSMIQLADRLSVTKRNVTALVDGLEKDELAVRTPHPTDRRSTLVKLTPAGEVAFAAAAEIQQKHLSKLLTRLDEHQQREVAKALNELTGVLSAKPRSGINRAGSIE